jgi:biopolymer transport protein ExbB/TolQ
MPARLGHTAAAFFVGLPLAALILGLIHFGPLRHTPAHRYVEYPVEWVEVVLFCCALGALAAKFWQSMAERRACRTEVFPRWDGKPVPASEAQTLLASVERLPKRLQDTYLGRRLRAVLDFLRQRRCAAELDDQLRTLADNDSLTLETSYSLTRLITWAIPILGFLGTVLGITGAISGATPEVLEKSLSKVTDGLAEAFDATALALALTMITMFISFLVERREQRVLESVDRFIDDHLAHRFQRGSSGEDFVDALRQNSQVLLDAMEQLVQRQAQIWAEVNARQQQQLSSALEQALDRTLQAHTQRLAAAEKQAAEQGAHLLQQLGTLSRTIQQTGQEYQASLARVAEAIAGQAAVLGQLQHDESNLIHLQAVLHQNLAALASASSFDQAVHSLTAAIHLLTAKTSAAPVASPPITQPRAHPGRAA